MAGTQADGGERSSLAALLRDETGQIRFKVPLSASLDKLGNNANLAMHYAMGWRQEGPVFRRLVATMG